MLLMIPYGRHEITEDDISAVVKVLRNEFLTQGNAVPAFEAAVAARTSATHAIAMANATAALHLTCLAMGVTAGDQVWTSPITFVASANCARYCGAEVSFVDIDPATLNICPERLRDSLRSAVRPPKVLIAVHFGGQSCDMAAIRELSGRYDFKIIEDASHAIGGSYKGVPIGACKYSEATVFSFHPVKIVTTGEGGVVTTNSTELAEKISRLRSHDITRKPEEMAWESDGPWYYQQIGLGFNYRITDIQAALGVEQLKRLDSYVASRNRIMQEYRRCLSDLPIAFQAGLTGAYSAGHLFVIRVSRTRRAEIFGALKESGIGVNVHYVPVHLQPYYKAQGFKPGDYPESELYYSEALTLPLFPMLSHSEQDHIVASLRRQINQ